MIVGLKSVTSGWFTRPLTTIGGCRAVIMGIDKKDSTDIS